MSARLTGDRARAIIAVIRAHPDGVTIAEIARTLRNPPETRTLREWVLLLRDSGQFEVEGEGIQTRCRAIATDKTASAPSSAPSSVPETRPNAAPNLVPNTVPIRVPGTAPSSGPRTVPNGVPQSVPGTVPPDAPNTEPKRAPDDVHAASAAKPVDAPAPVDIDALLKEAITYIVGGCGLPTSAASGVLRGVAREAHLDAAATTAFVNRGMTVLGSLTEAEAAAEYDVSAHQFATWRDHCGWAEGRAAPSSPGPLQAAPNRDEPNQGAANRAGADGSVGPRLRAPNTGETPVPRQTETRAAGGGEPGRLGSARPATMRNRTIDTGETPVSREGSTGETPVPRQTETRAAGGGEPGRLASTGPATMRNRTIDTGETPVPREGSTGGTPVPRERSTGGTPVPPNTQDNAVGAGDGVLKNVPSEPWKVLWWTLGAGLISALVTQLQTRPWLIGVALVGIAAVYGYRWLQRQRNAVAGNGPIEGSRTVASGWAAVRPQMRWAVGVGGAAVLIGVVALIWYRHVTSQPSKDAVKAGLAAALAPLPVTIPTIEFVNVTPLGELGCRIRYQAVVETTAPLYRRADTSTYLYGHAASELRTIDAAEVLLRGTEGARLLVATGATAPTRVRDVVLLETQTPAPVRAMANGMLLAWRRDGVWTFTIEQDGVDRVHLAGDPKPAGEAVFVLDVPADVARLNALIAENVAYARRVIAAAEKTASSRSEPLQTATSRDEPRQAAADRIEPNQAAPNRSEPLQTADVVVGARLREPSTGETPVRRESSTGGTPVPREPNTGETPVRREPSTGGTPVPRESNTGETPVPREPNTGGTPVPRQAAGSAREDDPGRPTQLTFPTERGAYVLEGDAWRPLPTNNGHFLEKPVPEDFAKQFDDVYRAAGWTIEESKRVLGDLAFDGSDPVPTLPSGKVALLYVGNLPGDGAGYPSIEVTALRTDEKGVRFTPLTGETPTIRGFGVRRVPATLERPISNGTVLRTGVPLAAGRYAISCGGQFFEFAVK